MRPHPIAVLALTAAAAAQTTHSVGPGGHPDIGTALAAAAPGDVILVQPGTYPSFVANAGVTIRAVTPQTVFVQPDSTASVPAGEALHLVGLVLDRLVVNAGTCTLDECTLRPGAFGISLRVVGARVDVHACAVGSPGAPPPSALGPFPGLSASGGAVVTAVDSSFRGMDFPPGAFIGQASPGVSLADATFHGSRVTIDGGDGRSGSFLLGGPGYGIRPTLATVWLADSTVRGGRATDLPGTPPYACPIAGGGTGRYARCTLLPACSGPTSVPGPMLGVHRAAPLQAGATFQLDFTTDPNGFVGVFATTVLGSATLAGLEQRFGLDVATAFPLAVLAADGAGLASGTWTLPPGTANLALWLQGVAWGPLPLQASPVTGGVVR